MVLVKSEESEVRVEISIPNAVHRAVANVSSFQWCCLICVADLIPVEK